MSLHLRSLEPCCPAVVWLPPSCSLATSPLRQAHHTLILLLRAMVELIEHERFITAHQIFHPFLPTATCFSASSLFHALSTLHPLVSAILPLHLFIVAVCLPGLHHFTHFVLSLEWLCKGTGELDKAAREISARVIWIRLPGRYSTQKLMMQSSYKENRRKWALSHKQKCFKLFVWLPAFSLSINVFNIKRIQMVGLCNSKISKIVHTVFYGRFWEAFKVCSVKARGSCFYLEVGGFHHIGEGSLAI